MRALRMLPFSALLSWLTVSPGLAQTPESGPLLEQAIVAAQPVEYCDLLEHLEKFENRMIRVHAIFETDFEKSVIDSPTCPTPGVKTWVDFDERWESRTERSVRHTLSHAKWRVPLEVVFVGKFKSDGGYGHEDMYAFFMQVYKVDSAKVAHQAK